MRSTRWYLSAFLLLVVLCTPLASSAAAPLAGREVLPNGLVLLHAERTALPLVKVVIAVKAGSVVEPYDKAGLSNLTAALLDEGTTSRSSKEISDAIEFVGGSLGVSGGSDYVTVTLSVLKKDLELGFDLMSDIILHPAFSEQEIARQKRLIKGYIKQQNEEPGAVASKAFLKAVFGEEPYGWPVEGFEQTLDAVSRQDIVDFHKRYYAPNNAIMAVVGDVSRKELAGLLEKYFDGWQKEQPVSWPSPRYALGKGSRTIAIDKGITQANIILGHLGVRRDNPDYYAVSVMNYVLGGGGFASRLMDNIRDNKGLSYDVHSSFSASKLGGSFEVGLQTKNESANAAIGEVLKEMERIRTEPVSDKELSDAKSYLTGSFPLRIDSNSKIAGFLVAVEFYDLGMDYVDKYKTLVNAVTKEDVLRVARMYLKPKDYVLVVVGNLKKADLRY